MTDPALADGLLSPPEAIERFLAAVAKPARILVAVSGGSDSLGLLHLLHRHAASLAPAVDLIAVTFDHALRPQSAAEAREVFHICQTLGIRHRTERWDGTKPGSGVSAAAREARYEALCRIALAEQASLIVTGHTLDDQIETVLMRAGRPGSEGTAGLSGMAQSVLLHQSIWLHRPLLSCRRQAIRDRLTEAGLAWIEDPSNADPRFERARIRADLVLGDEEVRNHLAEISAAADLRGRLSVEAAQLLAESLTLHDGVAAELSVDVLGADAAVEMHALGALAGLIGGRPYGVARDSLMRIGAFLASGQTGRMTAGRVVFDRRRDRLFLVRESRNLPAIVVAPGTSIAWDGRFRVSNDGDAVMLVRPRPADRAAAAAAFPALPGSLALQAYRSLPDIIPQEMAANGRSRLRPLIAPYERFVPQFDLKLAVLLAKQAGLDEFPPSPLNVFMRKT